MQEKTKEALKWIVHILDKNQIPYRVGGGMAVHLYGSGREVNDIDISMPGKYFSKLVPQVVDYVVAGPKHYVNEKWDSTTLSLHYLGQDIDLTDSDTLLMSSKNSGQWIKNKDIYEKWPDIKKQIDDFSVMLMHPKVLLEYKQHLDGSHQEFDREYLRRLIESNEF